MPLYNEEPARAAAALDAMANDLDDRGAGSHFDLFILSDTTDGDVALVEEEAVWPCAAACGRASRSTIAGANATPRTSQETSGSSANAGAAPTITSWSWTRTA